MVTQNSLFRLGAEQITLPGNESLGLVNTSYQLEAFPGFFVGGSVYGAATGKRGGFFTIGPEFTWRNRLPGHWYADLGLFVGGGGGGGANTLVGGGLMLRPHIDLLYGFGPYQAGLSASNVRFPYGSISSNQIGLTLAYQGDFAHTGYDGDKRPRQTGLRGGLGFDRTRGILAVYRGKMSANSTANKTVYMAGMRVEHLITPTIYWGLELLGAVKGGVGGYGEYSGTLGMELPVLKRHLSIGGRLALGMAGGGGVPTKGGLLTKAGVNMTAHLWRDTHLSIEGGYVVAPLGQMKAGYVGADLALDLDHPFSNAHEVVRDDYEWQVGAFRYQSVKPQGSPASIPFTAVEMKANRFLDEHFYYGLHVQFAAQGGTYGGYGAAFVALGYRTPKLLDRLSLAVEMALGGGGGGNVPTGGGALYMANAYLDYSINRALGIRIGGGRIRAVNGTLNSAVGEISVVFAYSVESRR